MLDSMFPARHDSRVLRGYCYLSICARPASTLLSRLTGNRTLFDIQRAWMDDWFFENWRISFVCVRAYSLIRWKSSVALALHFNRSTFYEQSIEHLMLLFFHTSLACIFRSQRNNILFVQFVSSFMHSSVCTMNHIERCLYLVWPIVFKFVERIWEGNAHTWKCMLQDAISLQRITQMFSSIRYGHSKIAQKIRVLVLRDTSQPSVHIQIKIPLIPC